MVYCVEEVDNGKDLQQLIIDKSTFFKIIDSNIEPSQSKKIELNGMRAISTEKSLYSVFKNELQNVEITAIPYFQWGNRAKDQEMRVWLRVK